MPVPEVTTFYLGYMSDSNMLCPIKPVLLVACCQHRFQTSPKGKDTPASFPQAQHLLLQTTSAWGRQGDRVYRGRGRGRMSSRGSSEGWVSTPAFFQFPPTPWEGQGPCWEASEMAKRQRGCSLLHTQNFDNVLFFRFCLHRTCGTGPPSLQLHQTDRFAVTQ